MRNEPFQIISQKTVVGCPCVLPVIHLSKIKLVGLKCSDRKHRTIYLQFLFHMLQEEIYPLLAARAVSSLLRSHVINDYPCFLHTCYGADLLILFLNFNKDKVTEIFTF